MDIKKKKEKKPSGKNNSSVVQLKNGSFSLAVTAIVLAIIVVVNLIIGQLPSKLLNWDLSETGIFSVSDTSKELLKDLDKDVTVEVVAETGNIDSRIEKFISIYCSHLVSTAGCNNTFYCFCYISCFKEL